MATDEQRSGSLSDLFALIWRRKLIVLGVTLLTVGAAVAGLETVQPIYEAKTTVSISPGKGTDELLFLNSIDQIVPVYAEAVTLTSTQEEAALALEGGDLGEVSVVTFEQTPIFEIRVRHSDPDAAVASAQALAHELEDRVAVGEVGIPSLTLEQLDTPSVPSTPVFPQPRLTLAVSIVIGLAFGIAAAALRELLTRKITTSEELAEAAQAPVFGELPKVAAVSRVRDPNEFYESEALGSFSEGIRDLRTNLMFSSDSLRSVLVTSPEGTGHGKTTVAFALASTFAKLGVRTLLVDGDLRRGRIAGILKLPRAPGLMEALQGKPIEDVIRRTSFENLDVLCCGEPVADPGEIFESQFLPVLKELEGSYEGIVIDAPPLVAVNDARIMSRSVDSTIMVASTNMTTRRDVRMAIERLELIGAQISAVVLNRSKLPRNQGYYAYRQTGSRSVSSR